MLNTMFEKQNLSNILCSHWEQKIFSQTFVWIHRRW